MGERDGDTLSLDEKRGGGGGGWWPRGFGIIRSPVYTTYLTWAPNRPKPVAFWMGALNPSIFIDPEASVSVKNPKKPVDGLFTRRVG